MSQTTPRSNPARVFGVTAVARPGTQLLGALEALRLSVTPLVAAPEAPTKPAESPTEAPTRQDTPPDETGRDKPSDPDIDEQIKRIIREIPDPSPQPGGQ